MFLFILLIVWGICGVLVYGLSFAFYSRKFKDQSKHADIEDRNFCIGMALFGCLSFISFISFLCTNEYLKIFKYGFRIFVKEKEEQKP